MSPRTLGSVLGASLLAAGLARAAILHVPGQYSTIQAALDAAGPGDTVEVAAGVYHEKIAFPASGSAAGGFIAVQAAAGTTPVLDGTGVAGSDMVLIDGRSWVRVAGLEICNDLGVVDGSGVRVLGAGDHIELLGNRIHAIHGQHAMGITVYATQPTPISNLMIDGNEVYDCQPFSSEAVTLNGNVDGFVVTDNSVHDVNNIGMDFIGGETEIQPDPNLVARNGLVRGNTVLRARQQGGGWAAGVYVDGGRDIVVEGNTVSECDVGIEIGAEHAGIVATGVKVRSNLIHHNDRAGLAFGGYDASVGRTDSCSFTTNTCYHDDTLGYGYGELWIQWAESNTVADNIFVSTDQDVLLYSEPGNVGNSLDWNLWYTAAGTAAAVFVWQGTDYTGFDAYRAATGQDAHSLFAEPGLVSPAAGDYRLGAGSTAIDRGDPAFVPGAEERDIDGEPRVSGLAVDMGADEVQSGAIFADGFESGGAGSWSAVVP